MTACSYFCRERQKFACSSNIGLQVVSRPAADFQRLGLLVRQVKTALDLFGKLAAAEDDVPRQRGNTAGENVDIHLGGADVDQGNVVFQAEVRLKGIFQGKGVYINHDRFQAGRAQHVEIAIHHLALGCHQHDIGAIFIFGIGMQILTVQIDVVDVEGNVLFGLFMDMFFQFRLGHHFQIDFFYDDGIAGNGKGDPFFLDFQIADQGDDCFGHGIGVEQGPVLHGIRRHERTAESDKFVASPAGPAEFANLDGVRTDVKAKRQRLLAAKGER